MQQPSELPEPYLRIGAICERVLEEKDNVISLIRIVDKLEITAQGQDVPASFPPVEAMITVVMSWAGGLGNHQVQIVIRSPGGEEYPSASMPVFLNSLDSARNFIINMRLPLRQQGLYWVEFLLNGQTKSRQPWRVLYQPVQLPGSRTNPSG